MNNFSRNIIIRDNWIIDKKRTRAFELSPHVIEVLEYFSRNFDTSKIDEQLLMFLKAKEIISEGDKPYNPFVVRNPEFNGKRLFVQLTNRCNLHCKHCYAESEPGCSDYFDFEEVKKIIDEATSLGISAIDFTGGEVITQGYFIELLQYMEQLPVIYSFFSNLSLITSEQIDTMVKLSGLSKVITSIDYLDPKKHNAFRGGECFHATMDAIDALSNKGVKVLVNMIVLKDNINEVESVIDYFTDKGIEVRINPVINYGRQKDNNTTSQEDEFQYLILLKQILEKKFGKDFIKNSRGSDCGIGDSLIFLDYKGNYQLCPGLTSDISDSYFIGNGIVEAKENLKKYRLRCGSNNCDDYSECNSGCRLRAVVEYCSDVAPDSAMCIMRRIDVRGDRFAKS